MEPKRTARGELEKTERAETPDKGRFASFKALVERIRERAGEAFAVLSPRNLKATAAALAVAVTVGCGEEDDVQPDAGPDHEDAAAEVDADREDAGNDLAEDAVPEVSEDAGADEETVQSLCEMYPEGDPHRKTFRLDDRGGVEGSDYVLNFRDLSAEGVAAFQKVPTWVFYYIHTGDREEIEMGPVGRAIFEGCGNTPDPCSAYTTPPTGDVNCTITLASDRVWRR